jgi:hypothetical protein
MPPLPEPLLDIEPLDEPALPDEPPAPEEPPDESEPLDDPLDAPLPLEPPPSPASAEDAVSEPPPQPANRKISVGMQDESHGARLRMIGHFTRSAAETRTLTPPEGAEASRGRAFP